MSLSRRDLEIYNARANTSNSTAGYGDAQFTLLAGLLNPAQTVDALKAQKMGLTDVQRLFYAQQLGIAGSGFAHLSLGDLAARYWGSANAATTPITRSVSDNTVAAIRLWDGV